jgi:hypothetical protein
MSFQNQIAQNYQQLKQREAQECLDYLVHKSTTGNPISCFCSESYEKTLERQIKEARDLVAKYQPPQPQPYFIPSQQQPPPQQEDERKERERERYRKHRIIETGDGWSISTPISLQTFCQKGDIKQVMEEIEKGLNDWNKGLYGACSGGHLAIVELMIEKGATDWEGGMCHTREPYWSGNYWLGNMSKGHCAILELLTRMLTKDRTIMRMPDKKKK